MKRAIILLFFFVVISSLFAQVNTAWVRRYNGSGNGYDGTFDYGPCMTIDNSGNIYVTGTSNVTGEGPNYILIKYDANGNQLWTSSYNGPANGQDAAWAVTTDASGNVYIVGSSQGIGSDSADYAVIKYNSAGDTQWVRRYNGPGNSIDFARQIWVDLTGNVFVTGYSIGSGTGQDYATIKYNSSGVEQWVARYDRFNLNDRAFALGVDNSGNVYVGGNGDSINHDFKLIKYDSLGNQVWIRTYNGPANEKDEILALVLDEDGNIYVSGNSQGTDNFDIMTIKYDTAGTVLWEHRYDYANDYEKVTAMTIDDLGYIYVVAKSIGFGTDWDYILLKYNPNLGDTVWTRRYNGPANGDDGAYWVTVDQLGNSYITGGSIGTGSGFDYATVKYNSAGDEQWVIRYNGTANDTDRAYCVAVDNSGNVYVTGESYGGASNFDIVTIKYTPSPTGWMTMANIPTAPSTKKPKSGSCMVGLNGEIYFLKGSNSQDFAKFTPNTSTGIWTPLDTIPIGLKADGDGKRPKKGASMAAFDNAVYALRGNNTPGFWKYVADTTETLGWKKLANIPTGIKNPKDASGLAAVTKNSSNYIFAMKGSKTDEFYLYDITNNTWLPKLKAPPIGPSLKTGYKKGSCLAYDGNDVYVMKGTYGDFFKYNPDADTWIQLRRYDHKTFLNSIGKKKKIGDGAGLAYWYGNIYLLKGGNTVEYWTYTINSDTWTQMLPESLWSIPLGATGKKKVKAGGALAVNWTEKGRGEGEIYAGKGGNTDEFYSHDEPVEPPIFIQPGNTNEGVLAKTLTTDVFKLTLASNPAVNLTAIRYNLSVAAPVNFKLYNVTGTLVKSYANLNPTKNGILLVDTKALPSGVYVLRFNAGAVNATRKLVLQK